MGFHLAFVARRDQHLNLFGDAQRVAAREAAPLGRLVTVIAQIQAESDEFILLDRVRDSGELRDGGAAQGGGPVECGVKGGDLIGGHRPHEFRGKVQRLVAEIEAQPFALDWST